MTENIPMWKIWASEDAFEFLDEEISWENLWQLYDYHLVTSAAQQQRSWPPTQEDCSVKGNPLLWNSGSHRNSTKNSRSQKIQIWQDANEL